MKSIKSLWAVLPLLVLSLFACHKSDDNSNNNNNNTTTPAAGQWKITYFFDKVDETSSVASFTFDFGSNGSLTATNGSQTWSGAWQTGVDDSANKFVISFNGSVPSVLEDLAEDWHIVKMEDTFMHFEHTSGGNGGTDIVKFTKI